MSAPRLRGLLFDFDGLIIDSERVMAESFIDIIGEWGATVTFEDFGHLLGSVDAGAEWDRLLGEWCGRNRFDLDERIATIVGPIKDALPLLPGVAELLDAAHAAGCATGIGTGSDRAIVSGRLERLGVLDRFDAIVTRADVERGKPFPDIYLELARRLDVEPADCLVLEDSAIGCEAALAAGMRVIACPSVVTAHCPLPDGTERVSSLLDVRI
jgi:putative hydrolase of the HAD superfamily